MTFWRSVGNENSCALPSKTFKNTNPWSKVQKKNFFCDPPLMHLQKWRQFVRIDVPVNLNFCWKQKMLNRCVVQNGAPKKEMMESWPFVKKFYSVWKSLKIFHVNFHDKNTMNLKKKMSQFGNIKGFLKKATFSCPLKVMKTCPTSVKKVANANKSILSRNGMQQKWLLTWFVNITALFVVCRLPK